MLRLSMPPPSNFAELVEKLLLLTVWRTPWF
jgi:hypothetical protein